jgi:hypothetical protein
LDIGVLEFLRQGSDSDLFWSIIQSYINQTKLSLFDHITFVVNVLTRRASVCTPVTIVTNK